MKVRNLLFKQRTYLVAVYKSGIRLPFLGRLVLEFLAVGIVLFNAFGNLQIDRVLYYERNLTHLRCGLAHVLYEGQTVLEYSQIYDRRTLR